MDDINKYPFRFLETYKAQDRDIFFGQELEIHHLHEMGFQSNILLVYGALGTGKTSLVQCGWTQKFESYDWVMLRVSRQNNINTSLKQTLQKMGNLELSDDDIDWVEELFLPSDEITARDIPNFGKPLHNIHLQHASPIYIFLDQLEELFIQGDEQERVELIENIREILRVNIPVRVVLAIDERYLGSLEGLFERLAPRLPIKKLQLAHLSLDKLTKILQEINQKSELNVFLEKGKENEITQAIFEHLKNPQQNVVEWNQFQAYMHHLYQEITKDEAYQKEAVINLDTVKKLDKKPAGILQDFLERQVGQVAKQLDGKIGDIWHILSFFVTQDESRVAFSTEELIAKSSPQIPDVWVQKYCRALGQVQVLRPWNDKDYYELFHLTFIPIIATFASQLSSYYLTNYEPARQLNPVVENDSEVAQQLLIITGFSAVEHLIEFLGKEMVEGNKEIRVLLGIEHGSIYGKRNVSKHLGKEIYEYWTHKGVSPLLSIAIFYLLEHLRLDNVKVKILGNLHAKMYVSEQSIIVGSSNFSEQGLISQYEANRQVILSQLPEEYEVLRNIAEKYYADAISYQEDFEVLLKNLLQYVPWQEALVRAVLEITEAEWLKKYPALIKYLDKLEPPLWPTQREAIGQALYILDNTGSLLIADPTGSGKTKLGAVLHVCLLNRFFHQGVKFGMDEANVLLICPPVVKESWQKEYRKFVKIDFDNIVSQGALSNSTDKKKEENHEKINNVKLLLIDEAHNFLNDDSNRSKFLQANMADQVVLYTATPINRKIEDLFRLIEILGVDNLSDEAIDEYEKLRSKSRREGNIDTEEHQRLKEYIRHFIIRRTKKELNQKIDDNKEAYKNKDGDTCRYPKQICAPYALLEEEGDIAKAEKINELAQDLTGLSYLRKFTLKSYQKDEETQQQVLKMRLKSARALAKYNINATLRSSKIALIEHIRGTKEAKSLLEKWKYDLPKSFKREKPTGNVKGNLEEYKDSLPTHDFTIELPAWFTNQTEYNQKIDQEIAIYEKIYELASELSLQREKRKAQYLVDLVKKGHHLVLAFDSRIISLHFIKKLAEELTSEIEFLVVTGNDQQAKDDAKAYFGFESNATNKVGLLSDALAEGVNLQKASALVLLDMPSVMRIAEQRIGRIDRMDSPHKAIEVYFPDDHEAFALKTDKRFFETAQTVENVLGSNITIPLKLIEKWDLDQKKSKNVITVDAKLAIKLYQDNKEKNESSYNDGIRDAFEGAKKLVIGDSTIVSDSIYKQVKKRLKRVNTLNRLEISKVHSLQNFGFFCIKGSDYYSPYWLYIDDELIEEQKVLRDLPAICQKLRENLKGRPDIEVTECIRKEQQLKKKYLDFIQQNQIKSLPNKKRRAIELLLDILTQEIYDLFTSSRRKQIFEELLQVLQPNTKQSRQADYYELAQHWLKIIQPKMLEFRQRERQERRRSKISHLKDKQFWMYLNDYPIPDEVFEELLQQVVYIENLENRISTCIIGLKLV